ncbi:hypothetical protein Dda_3023 [Drechslerella dactyloides]|uniref:Myb-like domain-containing protein n=1 Tax=Drechslerella dactyloides TaxID=74499 RepID=A0AAD6J0P7_DREDA|nr:hypothetical protein Dda_3023 [Drechslerella dactyloides]
MPSWSIENEHKLLLTIIKLLNISQLPKWEEVSREMHSLGLEFTAEGCRQHFQKIRKCKTPATPRKGGNGISKSTPSKRKLGSMSRDEAMDDEEMIITPSKKKATGGVDEKNPFLTLKTPKREIKTEGSSSRQTAHIFKSDRMDANGVIHIDDDEESLYGGE